MHTKIGKSVLRNLLKNVGRMIFWTGKKSIMRGREKNMETGRKIAERDERKRDRPHICIAVIYLLLLSNFLSFSICFETNKRPIKFLLKGFWIFKMEWKSQDCSRVIFLSGGARSLILLNASRVLVQEWFWSDFSCLGRIKNSAWIDEWSHLFC